MIKIMLLKLIKTYVIDSVIDVAVGFIKDEVKNTENEIDDVFADGLIKNQAALKTALKKSL